MDLIIQDSSLRDGNHAIKHQLKISDVKSYCLAADKAGVPIVEVGHGNGLGASSLQVGLSLETETSLLEAARSTLVSSKLAVHMIPGFSTINRNLQKAIDIGVDVVRVGCHCTEADTTKRYIEYLKERDIEAVGSLMMSHSVNKEILVEEALKMQKYGATGVSLYDSAGSYLPKDVQEKVSFLSENLDISVGFHAHNNLGMGIANSLTAYQSGAKIIDGSILGFGAGCGNAQLEVIVAVFQKMGIDTGIDLYGILDCADLAKDLFIKEIPSIKPVGIVSGLSGVFSGFIKHVEKISSQYNVDPRDVFFELGKRKVVAGQEDLIIEVAAEIKSKNINA
jgi:4-hydroxy 2-oxovalerate aldolase|tara:strand:+ start:534 stop:1544 length:1011 start_codon:yes stop_codon:yes gene_type:complete